ncbi:hypothetical protein HNQ95_001831 [Aminobacter ciceronei]|uniref:Uncharacterized protein n=1 Tax=Aminobacter ciceronei TaxID=150723 RepID=A0ABR6C4C1_9HYPH|nr:hypothetical protein [Aminobacter ciceronei]MBA9019837.1 hypothetical protein [Aminobacter ciceronei]
MADAADDRRLGLGTLAEGHVTAHHGELLQGVFEDDRGCLHGGLVTGRTFWRRVGISATSHEAESRRYALRNWRGSIWGIQNWVVANTIYDEKWLASLPGWPCAPVRETENLVTIEPRDGWEWTRFEWSRRLLDDVPRPVGHSSINVTESGQVSGRVLLGSSWSAYPLPCSFHADKGAWVAVSFWSASPGPLKLPGSHVAWLLGILADDLSVAISTQCIVDKFTR